MSKQVFSDDALIKSEIRALSRYIDRNEFNMKIVLTMVNELKELVENYFKSKEISDEPKRNA